MGWFKLPIKKKRTRGPAVTGKERLDRLKAAWIRKHWNTPAVDKMMLRELGIDDADSDALGTMEQGLKRFVRLREMLREDVEGEKFNPADLAPLMPVILSMVNPGYAQMMMQQQAALQAQQQAQLPAGQTEPKANPQPTQEGQMSLASMFVISQLNGKTPEQAASWLLSMANQHPQGGQFVQMLCQAPDDQLPAYLAAAVQQYPDLAGVVSWLRQRPDWLMQTIAIIRRQAQPQGATGI